MRSFLFFTFVFIPYMLFSQDFKLRNGEVYRFDENGKTWSVKPLNIGTDLNLGDSIKSLTPFTIEVLNTSLLDRFLDLILNRKTVFNFEKYPKGVRLDTNLKERTDKWQEIPFSGVTTMGNLYAENLAWVLQDSTAHSQIDVTLDLYIKNDGERTWSSINHNSVATTKDQLNMLIANNESFDVYTYVFWKDTEWNYFFQNDSGDNICYRIAKHSYYDLYEDRHDFVSWSEPYGEQKVLLVCSRQLLGDNFIESLIKCLNSDSIRPVNNYADMNIIGFDVKCFNLCK